MNTREKIMKTTTLMTFLVTTVFIGLMGHEAHAQAIDLGKGYGVGTIDFGPGGYRGSAAFQAMRGVAAGKCMANPACRNHDANEHQTRESTRRFGDRRHYSDGTTVLHSGGTAARSNDSFAARHNAAINRESSCLGNSTRYCFTGNGTGGFARFEPGYYERGLALKAISEGNF